MPETIWVIGLTGEGVGALGAGARRALRSAHLVLGGRRHLDSLRCLDPPAPPLSGMAARTLPIEGDLAPVMDAVAAETGTVCVLASGDPGFFGIVRPLAERFGPAALRVLPAASSVALAFARLGIPWDDAAVVSAHGRPLSRAVDAAARHHKVAVLVSPQNSPAALAGALAERGVRPRRVVVCERLDMPGERVTDTDLEGLAGGRWDPLAVVLLLSEEEVAPAPALAWGLPEGDFAHRGRMITKAEVRAVALGKLALPPSGVMWDVGAGSGSVGIEAKRLAGGLDVYAVERNPGDARRIETNAARHGVSLHVEVGSAPGALVGLPDPDRAFVGGGGLEVLDAVIARLRPGGRVVASFAAMDRAAGAARRLGRLVQVSLSRGETLSDGGVRLVAENPVFVVWGP